MEKNDRKKAKKVTVSRKKATILTVNRKSHYPIETLFNLHSCAKLTIYDEMACSQPITMK